MFTTENSLKCEKCGARAEVHLSLDGEWGGVDRDLCRDCALARLMKEYDELLNEFNYVSEEHQRYERHMRKALGD